MFWQCWITASLHWMEKTLLKICIMQLSYNSRHVVPLAQGCKWSSWTTQLDVQGLGDVARGLISSKVLKDSGIRVKKMGKVKSSNLSKEHHRQCGRIGEARPGLQPGDRFPESFGRRGWRAWTPDLRCFKQIHFYFIGQTTAIRLEVAHYWMN